MRVRDVLAQDIRDEGRRLLADLAAARKGNDGDRVEDAKVAWMNFTFVHADLLLTPNPGKPRLTEGPTVADLEAYIDVALIDMPGTASLSRFIARYIARSIHHRLVLGEEEP